MTEPPKPQSDDKALAEATPAWAAAVDTYRSTIRWVVVAFAAIATLMAGTAPLTGLGDVNDDRVWMVAVGAGAGVLADLASQCAYSEVSRRSATQQESTDQEIG